MIILDCLGEICPVPVLRLKKILDTPLKEDIQLVTDHSCVFASLETLLPLYGLTYTVNEPLRGVWEILIFREN
jgi:TusA-related sulfurtransferase